MSANFNTFIFEFPAFAQKLNSRLVRVQQGHQSPLFTFSQGFLLLFIQQVLLSTSEGDGVNKALPDPGCKNCLLVGDILN